ncbi:alpha/beta hydrolase [Flammeovirgaceae bacterium SG7u.111]|nr:alpha/beta hydrolase [Flammeovirgaceae bacterium SG7u.132]WPO33744.1 alpha/beta hydrolase [Flammeovirgaceae bacterium SG7u.111]
MKKLNFFVFCMGLSLSLFGQQKPIPRDTTYTTLITYNKIKKNYPEAVPAPDKLPKGVKEERDVVYTTLPDTPFGSRDLHVDVFQPKKKGKYPALIMVHGGGWRSGDKSMQIPMAQKLAAKGFVTVCVEYQLSLEAKFPAAVHNIKAAIRWMRANAEKYNIDPDKIAISGCSAGGQLAALVGMTNGVEKMEGDHGHPEFSSEIQAVVDIDGVIDFMAPLSLNLDRRPDSPDVEWLGGTFYEVPGTWKDASSIFWANENSAPILFLNSGYPRFHAGQDEMIGMFKIWDIYTEVHKFDVQVHPFWLFDPWVNPTVDYIAVFLTKSLTK